MIKAEPASALLCDTAVWYLVWVCVDVLGGVLWWCERCDRFKNTFSTEFFDGLIQPENSGMGVWACGCVLCGGVSDVTGPKTRF